MHHLKKVTIENFRSIRGETFPLENYTALIGYNNAGKTNILLGCNWLLTGSTLQDTDFYDKASPVQVIGIVSGITEGILNNLAQNVRESIRPYIDGDVLVIRRVQIVPGDRRSIKMSVYKPNIEENEDPWKDNPGGIDNAIKAIFPEPIIIGAIENIEEDVTKNKTGTTIGKLISAIISPIEERYGGQAREAMEGLKNVLDADGGSRAQELADFDQSASQKLKEFFPDVSIRLHVPTPELKEFFKSGTIKVYEEGQESGRDISSFGSGAQRSIQMALVRQLAEARRNEEPTPTCTLLLIDEPELYLHPQAIEQVRIALKQLSERGYQVIFATHSAQMVKAEDAHSAILVRKNRDQGTYRRCTISDAINQIMHGESHERQMEVLFTLTHSHQILFSETVLLAEGDTEQAVLPKLFETMCDGNTLGAVKCALVKLGGTGNMMKSMDILRAMDIPTKAIVDLDFAFTPAIQCGLLGAEDADIMVCKAAFMVMQENGLVILSEDGLPRRGGAMNTRQAFEHLASLVHCESHILRLHEKLLAHNIWLWRKGMVESHLGIESKSVAHWSGFVDRIKRDGCRGSIPDFEEIERLIAWIQG